MKQHYFFIGRTNKKNENEKHWEAVPILCFENNLPLQSVLEVYIFSKTEKNNDIDIIYDSSLYGIVLGIARMTIA